MPRPRITSRDVARQAGVSRTTVSFVLNRVMDAGISEDTRQRVLAVAEELGYVPDATAQALASGRTKTIGLVFRHPHAAARALPSNMQLIEGLMEIARQAGVRLLIDTVAQEDSASSYVTLTRTKRIDGLILLNSRFDDQVIYDLVHDGFPLVLLGRLPGLPVDSIEFDNRGGARRAVEHLLAQGHTRIGCIGYAAPVFTGVTERMQGYQDALAAAGLPYDETLIRYGEVTADSGFAATMSLLADALPTALFVSSDILAFGALAAIQRYGLRIPDDIAVVGFDDTPLARYTNPSLTTVHISFEEMGRQAGQMLLERMYHDIGAARQVLLDATVVIRESSVRHLPA